MFVDQIFRIFDKDQNGSIDFRVRDQYVRNGIDPHHMNSRIQEFMLATDMTGSGTPEEKLRWAFRIRDVNSDGFRKRVHL